MRSWFRSVLLIAAGVVLSSCTAVGPTRVDPNDPFDGIGQLLTPGTESVNVLMVHGMGADTNQDPQAILDEMARRLDLEPVGSVVEKVLLKDELPGMELGGNLLWQSEAAWNTDAPTLRILRYNKKGTELRLNFYLFDYWKALARIKCAYLVQPDSRLIGATDISNFCEDFWKKSGRGALTIHEPLGARPAVLNRMFKSGIVEWGLADAVIATSEFRLVLRKAIREAMEEQQADLASQRALNSPGAPLRTYNELMQQSQQANAPKFAVITRSLGSYVVFDALANASREDPESVLCLSRQIHMLANQLPLLRFSDIAHGAGSTQSVEAKAASNCSSLMVQAGIAKSKEQIPEVRVVAYHEPNDLLTFYLNGLDKPPFRFTNVVASFAKVWFPRVAADPLTAHTGQTHNSTIMDMLANGHE